MRSFNFRNSLVELVAVGTLCLIVGATVGAIVVGPAVSDAERVNVIINFGAALLGATVATVVSFVVARQSALETRTRDAEALQRQQGANALRLMVKASLVLSDLVAIRRAIDQCLQEANERRMTHLPTWRRVLALTGGHSTYEVDPAELTPLIDARETDLVHQATEVLLQHRTIISAVESYSIKRQSVAGLIATHQADGDGILLSTLTPEEHSKLIPLEMELESLIRQIRERLPALEKQASEVTCKIGPAMKKYLGDERFPVFTVVAEEIPGS